MGRVRIYVDTSVIGGCFDDEFAADSQRLLERAGAGELILVISDVTHLELAGARPEVRAVLASLPDDAVELIDVGAEAQELAELYVSEGVIGRRMTADAMHIAAATLSCVDLLVSWNFKHILNFQRVRGYNAINVREGHQSLRICTPRRLENDAEGY